MIAKFATTLSARRASRFVSPTMSIKDHSICKSSSSSVRSNSKFGIRRNHPETTFKCRDSVDEVSILRHSNKFAVEQWNGIWPKHRRMQSKRSRSVRCAMRNIPLFNLCRVISTLIGPPSIGSAKIAERSEKHIAAEMKRRGKSGRAGEGCEASRNNKRNVSWQNAW